MTPTLILFAAAGVLLNRVRGGWLELPGKKDINAAGFALFMVLLNPLHQTGLMLVLYALGCYGIMRLGAAPGVGAYIGYLCDMPANRGKPMVEWPPADLVASPFKRWPRVWGFVGLAFRAWWWGLGIAIVAQGTFWPQMVGLAMPVVVLACVYTCRLLRTKNPDGDGWEWQEVVTGALLWGAAAL